MKKILAVYLLDMLFRRGSLASIKKHIQTFYNNVPMVSLTNRLIKIVGEIIWVFEIFVICYNLVITFRINLPFFT